MANIIIQDHNHFETVLQEMIADGKDHLHVVADFDRTLTKAFVNGKPRSSLESILEQEGYLGQEYTTTSKNNFNKYYPIEIDPTIPLAEKKLAMLEWWTRQFSVMLRVGLTRDIIKKTVESDMVNLRIGYEKFFSILKTNNIPLLIFSATGLGYEAIYFCLQHEQQLSDNIDIIANTFVRDDNGKAIAIKEPIIHSYNKGETIIHDLPVYEKIKHRKNVILLGDSLGDVHMADGFDYKNIIKIGFLNHDTPENRKQFQENYDLIILNDGPMDEIINVLTKILP